MYKEELALLLIWSLAIHRGTCGDLKKIAHQPTNILVDYSAYRHISIVHFNVPENTVSALFKFTAKEEKTGGIGKCMSRDISVHLKSGSIPLVNPDGSKTAAKLLKKRRYSHSVTMTSAGDEYSVKVSTPAPGDWYAIAFRSWTDPDTEQITQQGLGASCDTVLDAELSIERPGSFALIGDSNERIVELNKSRDSSVMQFLMFGDSEPANLTLTSSCGSSCNVSVSVTTAETLGDLLMNETKAYLPFRPYTNSFHYLTMRLLSGEGSAISVIFPNKSDTNNTKILTKQVTLMKKSLPDFFFIDYEYLTGNSSKSGPINVTADGITVLNFEVGPISDVGGTLSVGIKLVDNHRKNVVIFGCISIGYYASITPGGGCIRKQSSSTTGPDLWSRTSEPSLVHIPYPEPGTWHLSLKAFNVTEPCFCLDNCTITPCDNCTCLNETTEKVEISVGSSPCIEGRCSSNGRCVHYMSDGFVFSACHCTGGYRGFDCADDSYVLTGGGIIIRLLMLTLSNLALLGSIYAALRRKYYTEAIVYTAVMFFSTLYHACEAGEDHHNFCLIKLSVLQFCDFFNALLSIWVTLVAMAAFGPRTTGFCQLTGAIVLALGSELDRTALWVFLLPAVTGCLLVCISWGMRCKARKSFSYPAHPYRNYHLPAGIFIVILGLVCYAFFQTRRNYHIVHSLWHVCVAVGVVLLLPPRNSMK